MRSVLAGDLGGTKCRYALVGEDFTVHRVQHVATVRERPAFLAGLERAIAAVLADLPPGLDAPQAAGFGTAGVVPPAGGSILQAPNLPLDGFPLAAHVQQRFGLPTTLVNDGRASAWGEFLRGHAVGRDPLLCLFFGTGIGIGLIVGGKPYGGAANAAGEIGHTTYRPDGHACPCGARGHFEAYCGGRAITERAAQDLGSAPTGQWTVGGVVAAAGGTDPRARAAQSLLDEAALAACTLVENACTLLNPAAVVLGGGVLDGWPDLRARIEAHVRRHVRPPVSAVAFAPSLGGSDAILWGAAAATGALWP
ncbi:MAG: ROK family protein [Planctomycetes bacterium]|nr:ROK family protein [Planctomycetota bacterium]